MLRVRFRVCRLLDGLALFLLLLACAGHILRDQWLPAARLTYAPLTVIGLAVALLGGLRILGGQRRRLWAAILPLAVAASVWAAWGQLGHGRYPALAEGLAPTGELTILQQNVWWGGGWDRSLEKWAQMQAVLLERRPDILILSEAPEESWLEGITERFEDFTGRGSWSSLAQSAPEAAYGYRLVVLSPWPHGEVRSFTLHGGAVLDVEVQHPDGPLRVWAVDGVSDLGRDRPAMLSDLWSHLEAATAAGRPVDILGGDFNAPARSVGFDRVRHDYWLASEHSSGWRATWPSGFPLLDVDHLWLRRGVFSGRRGGQHILRGSDHRGTWVHAVRGQPASAHTVRPIERAGR